MDKYNITYETNLAMPKTHNAYYIDKYLYRRQTCSICVTINQIQFIFITYKIFVCKHKYVKQLQIKYNSSSKKLRLDKSKIK